MVFVFDDELFNDWPCLSFGGQTKQGVDDGTLQVASGRSVASTTARNMECMVSQIKLVKG
jgi:hypothetical protein